MPKDIPKQRKTQQKPFPQPPGTELPDEEGYLTDEDRSRGYKLGPRGRAIVSQKIIEGWTNRQINIQLIEEKILQPGDSISNFTYANLRALPENKVDAAKLTEEAQTVGFSAVSRIIVDWVILHNAALRELIDPATLNINSELSGQKVSALSNIVKNSSEMILSIFSPEISQRVADYIRQQREGAQKTESSQEKAVTDAVAVIGHALTSYIKGELSKEQLDVIFHQSGGDQP